MDPLPTHFWFRLIFAVASLLCCALFSFMETSVTTLRLFNLKELAKKTGRYQSLFHTLETAPQRVLIAILIANCISNVIAADLITDLVESSLIPFNFASGWSFFLGVTIATFGILICGDIIPKTLAQTKSDRLFQSTLWLTNITFYSMSPFVYLLSHLSQLVINLFGSGHDDGDSVSSEQEIQFLIQHIRQHGKVDPDKFEMLHSIFDLADTSIKEIMVPALDVVTLNINTSLEDTLKLFVKHHFSRIPVYETDSDNIIGMVHQKDIFMILAQKETKSLKELVRPILFVPESMKVNQLLRQFKQQRHHIAMVLNEHGSINGLVTLEDTLEEIVGDINDEHESVAQHIVALEQGGWLVYGGVDLETLEKELALKFVTNEAVTLGGFLSEQLQHLPKKGEQVLYEGYSFQVQKATKKRVIQVLVYKEE